MSSRLVKGVHVQGNFVFSLISVAQQLIASKHLGNYTRCFGASKFLHDADNMGQGSAHVMPLRQLVPHALATPVKPVIPVVCASMIIRSF